MTEEEKIQETLVKKFSLSAESVVIRRPRRISLQVEYARFKGVLEYALRDLAFTNLCSLVGLDEGETFGIIYHLARNRGMMLSIRTSVPRGKPVLETITGYYSSAEIYERELVDLLGIQVQGLGPGPRYPLTDDWPQGEYPLRKDWKQKKS